MEIRERSGLAVFVAEPGGGKSTLLGALGYLAARRGVQVTLLDPSGPLARLAAMPELAPYSRVLNLTGSEQGTLAPYALIPTPLRAHFAAGPAGDREYEIALSNARAERRMLVQDICSMLVPPQVAREASTATLLRHAVRPGARRGDVHAGRRRRAACRRWATTTATELATPAAGHRRDAARDAVLRLAAARPARRRRGADRDHDGRPAAARPEDRARVLVGRGGAGAADAAHRAPAGRTPLLRRRRCTPASWSASTRATSWRAGAPAGRSWSGSPATPASGTSRPWSPRRTRSDILGLDVQNLVSTVFVGRIAADPEIAAEALRLLRVPTDVGYEETLASLSASGHRLRRPGSASASS